MGRLGPQSLPREGDHLESPPRAGPAGAHLQLDPTDHHASRRNERLSARGLGRHLLLPSDPRAVAPRAVGRLQVREDLIARRWLWAVQGLVTLAVVVFVSRSIAHNWSEFRSLHVTLAFAPGWIAGSVVMVFLTYAMQIESWRRILAGWSQRLPFGPAARTWSVANLGRYVPGTAWSVAGLVVLAQQAGVAPCPAAACALVIQPGTPGGGGVRRLVLVGLLAPFPGSGGAVVVSVASRVLLTLMEAAAALLTLPLRHRPQESAR